MQELRLVAVSEDGTYLVLATAGRGTRFTLPVDDRLRAAVRGHFSRLGQFEIEVESPLRPKEIQARIRSGETAEEIAESAGIPVERVRWFEGPVLQEREYMAQQAQRVAVRRPGESTPGPPLGETVEERLGRGGVDLDEAEWDSWKCEDSTWRIRLSFFDNGRPHAAEWVFDPRRRHVSPLDEVAARLTSVEWDDETMSDTVTPLVPRRPAMKVVPDSRDHGAGPSAGPRRGAGPAGPAARGIPIPSEAENPGERAPEPLRAAEPREYIVERGRMVDPRPAFPSREAPAPPPHEAQPSFGVQITPVQQPDGEERANRARPALPGEEAESDAWEAVPGPRTTEEQASAGSVSRSAADEIRSAAAAAEAEAPVEAADALPTEAAAIDTPDTTALSPATPGDAVDDAREETTAQDKGVMHDGDAAGAPHEAETYDGAVEPVEASPEAAAEGPEITPADVEEADAPSVAAAAPVQEDEAATAPEPTAPDKSPVPGNEAQAAPAEAGTAATTAPERPAAAAGRTESAPERRRSAPGRSEKAPPRETPAGPRQAPVKPAAAASRPAEAPKPARPSNPAKTAEEPAAAAEADRTPQETPKPAPPPRPPATREPARPPAKKKPAGRPSMPAAQTETPVTPAPAEPPAPQPQPQAQPQRAARGRRKAKGKRASVPSWDEIMFGARRPE